MEAYLLQHPGLLLLVMCGVSLIAYPVMSGLTRMGMEAYVDFLDRRDARRRLETRPDHLVTRPPVGTSVTVIANSEYLAEYHGAAAGTVGTVVEHSQLSKDDDGVLVSWGLKPKVRMELWELTLAEPTTPSEVPADRVDAKFDAARLKLSDEQRAEDGLLDPDQPTESAHREWLTAARGPIGPDEFTATQRAAIRAEFGPG